MREGSLDQPVRKSIDWESEGFYNEQDLDAEMRRVFDVCHGCRRCFNLCESFPTLFDLVDSSVSGEVDGVSSSDFKKVVDNCTLCDLCFVNKCPYVPPHEFNIDFPHLMLRYRSVNNVKKPIKIIEKIIRSPDFIGFFSAKISFLLNFFIKQTNSFWRKVLEKITNISKESNLPKYVNKTLCVQLKQNPIVSNLTGNFYGKKVVVFATCFCNYHNTNIGLAAVKILSLQGFEVETLYPGCCGMPLFEAGDLKSVVVQAEKISTFLKPYIDSKIPVISIVPSCSFMLKSEWPLLLPDNELIKNLSKNVFDISEFIVNLHKTASFSGELKPIEQENVTLHLACHSRAQNIGAKAAEMLRLIPNINVQIIEKCSGHGGLWGMMKATFPIASKYGKNAVKQALNLNNPIIMSECPLALKHIMQGIENSATDSKYQNMHPIELLAKSLGV